MPATKSSTEVLMSLQQTIKHVWDCIADMMLRLGYLCEHIEWKDEVGIHFKEQYHENMKVVTERILPMFDRYNLFLNQLIEIVDDYTSAERGNADIAATPVSPSPPRNEFPSADDPDFQKEAEEGIKRIAEYAEFPKNQQDFFELDKDELKLKLEDAMRREDSVTYHQYRLAHPDSPSLNELKKETTIRLALEGEKEMLSMGSPALYDPNNNTIYVYKEWWDKENNNLTLFGAIMHEYEHKQQNDATLRGEVIVDAMRPAAVDSKCLNEQIEKDADFLKKCEEQIDAYFKDTKELRSFKAQDIAEEYYKPQVIYRNPKYVK